MYLLHYHYIKDKLRHRTKWSIRLDPIHIKSIEYIRAKSIFEFTHILDINEEEPWSTSPKLWASFRSKIQERKRASIEKPS